jgi:hypothetical protein
VALVRIDICISTRIPRAIAPALRHSAIILCIRTQGRCNQHGMHEGILG